MSADVFAAMGFGPKLRTAFAKAKPKIQVIGQLTALTPAELMRLPGMGPVGLHEVETVLAMHQLALAPREIGSGAHG